MRIVFVGLFLALGVAGIAIGVKNLFGVPKGWREISPSGLTASAGMLSEDLTLNYDVGRGSASASRDNRNVSAQYSEALNEADRIFDASKISGKNLAYLNAHPNEWVTVDPALYDALRLIEETGCRNVWLGSLSSLYYELFLQPDGSDLSEYDPALDPVLGEECRTVAGFARDPASLDLRFDGDAVMLSVSEECIAFANETGLGAYLDLFWMRNAFVIDYVAERLTEKGYTAGYIVSCDGFLRNLSDDDTVFSCMILDPGADTVLLAGELLYSGTASLVRFRSYCFPTDPDWFWVAGEDGYVRHPYLSVSDGLPQAAITDLLGFSRTAGCAETALRLTPIFTADELSLAELAKLKDEGVGYVYTRDLVVHVNFDDVTLPVYSYDEVRYSLAHD